MRERARVGIVAAGGAAGAFARWRLAVAMPTAAGAFPVTTFLVNLTGAGLLGYLVGRVPVRGPRSEAVRLLLGTGALGGFTTFSTFAVEVARRAAHGHADTAVTYAVLSVVAGIVAAIAGLAVGAAAGSRR